VNRSYLSKVEKGATYVGPEIIGKLAAVLEVEPAELLRWPPRRGRRKQDMRWALPAFTTLPANVSAALQAIRRVGTTKHGGSPCLFQCDCGCSKRGVRTFSRRIALQERPQPPPIRETFVDVPAMRFNLSELVDKAPCPAGWCHQIKLTLPTRIA
jgi:hypothetical protein